MNWLDELQALAARYGNAVSLDLACLTLADAWGLYRMLCHVAGAE